MCAFTVGMICCLVYAPWTLAQHQSGTLVSWGQPFGSVSPAHPETKYDSIAVGAYHYLLLRPDGVVVARGENANGQCTVPCPRGITAIAAGFYHSLALRSDGSICAWGDNTKGQRDAPSEGEFVAIAAGAWHSLAIRSDGSLVAWGWNEYGQCDVPAGNAFTAISGGRYHSLALKSDGSLVAWGGNGDGQCDVPAGNDFVAIASGSLHNLALRSDGSLVAWGRDEYGQCKVPEGNDFVAIAAGAFHSLALRSDGSVAAWGYDSYAQCDVPTDPYVVGIAAGGFRSFAIETKRPEIEIAEPVNPVASEPVAADVTGPVDVNSTAEEADADLPDSESVASDVAEPVDANSVAADMAAEMPGDDSTTPDLAGPVDANSTEMAAEVPDEASPEMAEAIDVNVVETEPIQVIDANGPSTIYADANTVGPEDANTPASAPIAEIPPADANEVAADKVGPEEAPVDDAKPAAADKAPESKKSKRQTAGMYEGVEFYACADPDDKRARPVYHFTSETLTPHFYTISKEERDRLIDEHPDIWTYEGVAFYAYPDGNQPEGAIPVYRFWSNLLSTHFYTIDENEKNTYIKDYPDLCTYQGIAWYADRPGGDTAEQGADE